MKIKCHRSDEKLVCQIDQNNQTLIVETKLDYLNKQTEDKINFSSKMLDLLSISHYVLMIDKAVSRMNSIDQWMRTFDVVISVNDVDFWISEKTTLVNLLNYLSGDRWSFSFIPDGQEHFYSTNHFKEAKGTICMLSGGLDSLIGAINLLESKISNFTFVSIIQGGSVNNKAQLEVIKGLTKYYNCDFNNFDRICLRFSNLPTNKERTTRTRSFAYFTTALAKNWLYEETTLLIPENGFISLNIPITNSRLGSSTTRTTNQYYLNLLERIYNDCEIKVKMVNPYKFMTKGEMINDCLNKEILKALIPLTVSCANPDTKSVKVTKKQCGYCWPCIIRRAALKRSNMASEDYYSMKLDNCKEAKYSMRAYNKLIIVHKEGNHASAILQNGPIVNELSTLISLYRRGMDEIEQLLKEIK